MKTALIIIGIIALGFFMLLVLGCCKAAHDDFEEIKRDSENEK